MYEFLIANWDSALVVLLFIVGMIILLKKGYVKQVSEILFYLVTEAEAQFGGGTGELKYAAVTAWLYERLPAIVKILFTVKQIDKLIEEAVQRMKDYLSENAKALELISPSDGS